MKEYLQKLFYKSYMKMLIRIADGLPKDPRSFIFTYETRTSGDQLEVSCDTLDAFTVKYNGKLIENGVQICNFGIKEIWNVTIVAKGTLTTSKSKSVFVKTSLQTINSILSVRGFFFTSTTQAIFPICMTPDTNTNLFCDSNGTNFYTNIIMPSSYAKAQCTDYLNVLYTI